MFTFIRLLIPIALLALLLAACTEPEDKKDPRFIPQLNPHPKYFITVEGDIDPNIADDLTLSWHIAYATHNEACRKVVNYYEGATVARFSEDTVTFLANAGYYRYKLPLDKYLPGYCRWEAASIEYYFKSLNKAYNVIAGMRFVNDVKIKQNAFSITWQCGTKPCRILHKTTKTPFYLPKQTNFHYIVSIINEKRDSGVHT